MSLRILNPELQVWFAENRTQHEEPMSHRKQLSIVHRDVTITIEAPSLEECNRIANRIASVDPLVAACEDVLGTLAIGKVSGRTVDMLRKAIASVED